MLVLSRKKSEQIVVPPYRLTITVLGITGNRVRLGFSAPPGVSVQRREIVGRGRQDHARPATAAVPEELAMSVRVLIADADQYLVNAYRQCLEQQGFTVTTATSGLECVEKLRERTSDLLVIDPGLPWGSGDGVLAVMHEDPDVPRVPVIVLTDARDRGVLYRLAPFRVDDFQVKPLSGKRLTERILAFVKRRSMEVSHEKSDSRCWPPEPG
ncbi:MAG: hypothetical protein A2W31_17620 [Planctomycetes bacterium RBG_16_64_10]|nr:MAG: hypothetical protein A2W31_17620 [Planctomycetes bacterium RBG_16_64_10]